MSRFWMWLWPWFGWKPEELDPNEDQEMMVPRLDVPTEQVASLPVTLDWE